MRVFDLYSGLLRYPSDRGEFCSDIDSLDRSETTHLKYSELGNLQEDYVESFDFSEQSSLQITEHISTEEKEKTVVLAGLAAFRKTYGCESHSAPPDYLPDILKSLQNAVDSTYGVEDARMMSGILLRAVGRIENILSRTGSIYLPLLRGLKTELHRLSENTEG